MATKIIHKKSSTTNAIPTASSLEPGELAINLADAKLFTKTTGGAVIELGTAGGGASSINDDSLPEQKLQIGNAPVNGKYLKADDTQTGGLIWGDGAAQPSAVQNLTEFVATAGQTVFTVNYTVGAVNVFRNGVRLQSSDITATNGTSITLANACTVGDNIEVEAYTVSGFVSQSAIINDSQATATAGQTSFSITYTVGAIQVFMNGIKLSDTDYTATNGTHVVLASGATAGDILDFQTFVVDTIAAQRAVLSDVSFTATAGQTTFSTAYDVNHIFVFLNGVKLNASDFTATNGTSIVLASGASAGDILDVHKFTVSDVVTVAQTAVLSDAEFTATAGQTTFTTNYDVDGIFVFLNGVKLQDSDYTASNGTTVVLTVAADAGDLIEIVKFAVASIHAQAAIKDSQEFTATAGQTTFSYNYTVGALDVFLNGIKLPSADFTASNGTSVVLATGAQAGSVIELVKLTASSLNASAAVISNVPFTATAGQTTFSVTYTVGHIEVFLNGIKLPSADYTANNGTSVVLAVAAQAGDSVEIQKITVSSVSTTDISADATPTLGGNLTTGNYTVDGVNISQNIPSSLGTAGQVLSVNSGASATEWATPAAGSMEFIASSGAISNVANVSFTGFDASKYDSYRFVFSNIVPVNDNVSLDVRTSSDGGSSYDSGTYDYRMNRLKNGTNLGYQANNFGIGLDIGSDGSPENGCSGELIVFGAHLVQNTYLIVQSLSDSHTGALISLYNTGFRTSVADVDAIQFFAGSGNLESGTINMYGIRNS